MQSNHEGELVEAVQRARGRCAAIIVNAGGVDALRLVAPRRAGRLRRRRGRAAPLEPQRARAVAAHLGGRTGRHRLHRGLRRPRLRAGGRGGGKVAATSTVRRSPRLPPMETGLRADRLRAGLAGRGLRRAARHPAGRTSATSPGSPARPRCCSCGPTTLVFVTDGRYGEQSAEQLGAAGVDARHRGVDDDRRASRPRSRPRPRASTRLGLEAESRHLGPAATLRVRLVPRRRAGADRGPGRGPAPGEGRGRGGADRGRGGRRRRRAGRGAAAARRAARGARGRRSALEVEMRRAGASGPSFETIVAAGPNGAKPHARPVGAAHRARASWW